LDERKERAKKFQRERTVSIRRLGKENQQAMPLDAAASKASGMID